MAKAKRKFVDGKTTIAHNGTSERGVEQKTSAGVRSFAYIWLN